MYINEYYLLSYHCLTTYYIYSSTSTYNVLALLRWNNPTTKLSVSSSYVIEHNFSPPVFFKSRFNLFKNASPLVFGPEDFFAAFAFFPFAAFFLPFAGLLYHHLLLFFCH